MARRDLNLTLALMLAICMAGVGCAVWFTASALRDTGLAARQRLTDVYRGQLTASRKRLAAFWEEKEAALRAAAADASPAPAFATLVTNSTCDAALLLDDSGNLRYPLLPSFDGSPADESQAGSAESEMLLALEKMGPTDPLFDQAGERLADALNNYESAAMPSPRRVFLMSRLQELDPNVQFPTLEAERLALQQAPFVLREEVEAGLSSPRAGVTAFRVEGLPVIALFESGPLLNRLRGVVDSGETVPGIEVRLLNTAPEAEPFLSLPVGAPMPDWRLDLHLVGPDPFAVEAQRRGQAYLLAGGALVVCVICLFAVAAVYVWRQVRLARLKNDLIATVSHELRTPVSSIRVLVETLLEGGVTGEKESREYLEMISREIARLGRLVDNFLTFSRMERNGRRRDFAEVPLGELLCETVESARERFNGPDRELRLECPERLPRVFGNRDSLMTVFLNLLDNAYKYTGEKKKAVVRARAEGNEVVVEVEDNGLGLSALDAKRVFGRFYQVDRSLSRSSSGCGLGLAIVKHLVEEHDGTISVRSEPGRGSTFVVRLPIVS
jgi:signal transduction histidine kinase